MLVERKSNVNTHQQPAQTKKASSTPIKTTSSVGDVANSQAASSPILPNLMRHDAISYDSGAANLEFSSPPSSTPSRVSTPKFERSCQRSKQRGRLSISVDSILTTPERNGAASPIASATAQTAICDGPTSEGAASLAEPAISTLAPAWTFDVDDDEDEVFFGAISEQERQRSASLQKRRRTMILVLPVRYCEFGQPMCLINLVGPHFLFKQTIPLASNHSCA
jgi:hypothetical protein